MHIIDFEARYKPDGTEVHWVSYAQSPIEAMSSVTVCPVAHVKPKLAENGEPSDQNDEAVLFRWSEFFEPAYSAWLVGGEVPENGMAIAAWPAMSKAQAAAFRRAGVVTVEDVAGLTDSEMEKVRIPGMHTVREQAKQFLESRDVVKAAEDIAAKDREIAELRATVDALAAKDVQKRGPGRPRRDAA